MMIDPFEGREATAEQRRAAAREIYGFDLPEKTASGDVPSLPYTFDPKPAYEDLVPVGAEIGTFVWSPDRRMWALHVWTDDLRHHTFLVSEAALNRAINRLKQTLASFEGRRTFFDAAVSRPEQPVADGDGVADQPGPQGGGDLGTGGGLGGLTAVFGGNVVSNPGDRPVDHGDDRRVVEGAAGDHGLEQVEGVAPQEALLEGGDEL